MFFFITHLNIIKTGDDTETLRKVEALIQADFKNGLPPHLQPNAKSMAYVPGSDQSRIFVASNSEFSSLHATDVQKILRDRLILVHGNSFDYNYGWDLESFGRLHDVDKNITVHGEIENSFAKHALLRTAFSFYACSSHETRTLPSPGVIAGIPCNDHHTIKRGLPSPQCHLIISAPKEPLYSLSVRKHSIA